MTSMNKYMQYKKNKSIVQPSVDQMERWLNINKIDHRVGTKDQIRICNPDGDTKFCMAICKSKALVHDFRPDHEQYDGTFIRFVSKYKNITIQESINEVCGNNIMYADSIREEDEEEVVENIIELPNGSISLRDESESKIKKIVMNYLINERALNEEAILQANIHYLGTSIVVPYYEYGMIVYWQLRKFMTKMFQFPPSSDKTAGDFLYGFDNIEPCSLAIIVESIFNVLSIGSDCGATGGAALKDGQIKLLKILNPQQIILAPDNDSAGVASVVKDYLALKKGNWEIFYCLPPYSSDPKSQMDWNDMKQKGLDPRKYIMSKKRKVNMLDVFNGIDYKSWKLD